MKHRWASRVENTNHEQISKQKGVAWAEDIEIRVQRSCASKKHINQNAMKLCEQKNKKNHSKN